VYAVRHEIKAKQLAAVRLKGIRLHRHFHVIHNESRILTHSARAFVDALGSAGGGRLPASRKDGARRTEALAPHPEAKARPEDEHSARRGKRGAREHGRGSVPRTR
jgi:hypothetical protein